MKHKFNVAAHILSYIPQIKEELLIMNNYQRTDKDILIVVHNQLSYLQECIESIRRSTKDYHLYIWDNGSNQETKLWLGNQQDLRCIRSEENLGFIIPNNRLAKMSTSPYLILLNSDTVVQDGWDRALIAHLQIGYAQVGYIGGHLNEEAKGHNFCYGSDIDFIPGWCFAIPRAIYHKFGLFDEKNLFFAYGEDADLSLRIKEAALPIHALHLNLVIHHENKTILEVAKIRDCRKSFGDNHLYLKRRWGCYLRRPAQKSPK